MMDLIEKESLCLAMMSESKKCCADCKTTKTPLWRGGPAGPKSLCNACGIRYRKRRVSMVGLSNVTYRKRDRSNGLSGATTTTSNTTSVSTATTASTAESDGNDDRDLTESLERKLMALGKDFRLQRSPSVKKQRFLRRRKLKEEEQAAVCLMALSCDSIFA